MMDDPHLEPEPLLTVYVVINLRRLKNIHCVDKDAVQDTVIALRKREISYIVLRWHESAQTYVKMDVEE